jgi:hypothetical protein
MLLAIRTRNRSSEIFTECDSSRACCVSCSVFVSMTAGLPCHATAWTALARYQACRTDGLCESGILGLRAHAGTNVREVNK